MSYFPAEGWLDEYGRVLDESSTLDDLAYGWNDGFDGDIHFVIEDLPLAETKIRDLPPEIIAKIPEPLLDSVEDVSLADAPAMFDEPVRRNLPEVICSLLEQIEDNVIDGAIHAFVGLEGGDCNEVEVLDDAPDCDTGFVIRGDYESWRDIVDGRPPASALLSGDLELDGNSVYQIRYSAMFQLLGELAADVETTYLFGDVRRSRQSSTNWVLDQAVRQPAVVQRTAERQLTRTLNLF